MTIPVQIIYDPDVKKFNKRRAFNAIRRRLIGLLKPVLDNLVYIPT